MRVAIPTRRPPTVAERLLGRRRARRWRRRAGLLAFGAGYSLLRPRAWRAPAATLVTIAVMALAVARYA